MGRAHDDGERVHPQTVADWATWLADNHDRVEGVWLVSWKKHTGRPAVSYDDAVTEALRFGWIDSLSRRLDDDRTMLWCSPRRSGSGWSRPNKQRIERLDAEGRMEAPGRAVIEQARREATRVKRVAETARAAARGERVNEWRPKG